MNGRRAPGSAAPLVVVRTSCGPSAKPPPRITHNASALEAGAIVGLDRTDTADSGLRVHSHTLPAMSDRPNAHSGHAKLAGRHRAGRAEVRAIAPRLVAPRKAPAIGAARGFLPLRFGRQRHVPAVAQRLRDARRRARRRLERRFEPAAIRDAHRATTQTRPDDRRRPTARADRRTTSPPARIARTRRRSPHDRAMKNAGRSTVPSPATATTSRCRTPWDRARDRRPS